MGCDIHWVIEKRRSAIRESETEGWVGVAMKYHTPNLPSQAEIPSGFGTYNRPLFSERNYAFFAALAGVRGDGPDPRGLPEDLSDLAKMDVEGYGQNGHSHSWATLREFVLTWLKVALPEVHRELIIELAAARLENSSKLSPLAQERLAYYAGISWMYEIDDYRVIYYFDN